MQKKYITEYFIETFDSSDSKEVLDSVDQNRPKQKRHITSTRHTEKLKTLSLFQRKQY